LTIGVVLRVREGAEKAGKWGKKREPEKHRFALKNRGLRSEGRGGGNTALEHG